MPKGWWVDASFEPAWQARGPRVSRRCAGDWSGPGGWGGLVVGPTGKSGPFKSADHAYRLNMGRFAQLGP